MSRSYASVFLVALALGRAAAYPSGAPDCMIHPPSSGFHASTTGFMGEGYTLTVAPSASGATITISGPAAAELRGLSLIASRGTVSSATEDFQVLCSETQLTHTSPSKKALPWTFEWVNAEQTAEPVSFDYTLLESKSSWAQMPQVSHTPVAVSGSQDASEPMVIADPADMTTQVTGCCYEVGYGAMMVPVYSSYLDVYSEADCPVAERMGGATRFEASECAIVKAVHDKEAAAADESAVDPATLVDVAAGVGPVITDTTKAPTAAPATEATTTTKATTKKAPGSTSTKAAAATTKKATTKKAATTTKKPTTAKPTTTTTTTVAATTEAEMTAEVTGCCFEVGYGAMMVPVYSEYQDVSSEADCPTTERMGGATRFEASECAIVKTVHEREARDAAAAEAAPEEGGEMSIEVTGCCYEVGYGAMMAATYSEYRDVQRAGDCPVAQRMGGATVFEAAECAIVKTVHEREARDAAVAGGEDEMTTEVTGCCFEVGYGAMMVPVYSEYQDVASRGDCPVSERMGGATMFVPEECSAVKAKHAAEQTAQETQPEEVAETTAAPAEETTEETTEAAEQTTPAPKCTRRMRRRGECGGDVQADAEESAEILGTVSSLAERMRAQRLEKEGNNN